MRLAGGKRMDRAANEFQGFFAEFFDRLHAGCGDADVYPVLLKAYGKKILEQGSGTGRIAIPLAEVGNLVFCCGRGEK